MAVLIEDLSELKAGPEAGWDSGCALLLVALSGPSLPAKKAACIRYGDCSRPNDLG